MPQVIRPTDDQARALAQSLLAEARYCALAVTDPETGTPYVARVALGLAPDRAPVSLISDLAHHTRALRANANCALLVGEPGPKGDPLTHPRLTVQARASFVLREGAEHAALTTYYLQSHPKSQLYIGFTDFGFVRFTPIAAHLNGGFGKAFRLTPQDLAVPVT
ncbi:HugZ family protein [Actibacterium sp. XHP0104]|uniref:HugZ family pyridoxamine 5'-phosphate oxidase n=1 Tax=Actibacterium sp. XHP0104 TaxID=2984335 RepID=UPI0021E84576|nr:pyridoxamine 5'-phosphate oxidase family protein [Actibacterium sp. XHP0104]MCV2881761.1 pyridoxamine 5'-phosphate oxidase family protein [Actibacterium sp. XHP0104]